MRSDAGPCSREFLSAYISGYADGEGCFTVSISPRRKLRAGWEVRPSFSVSQNGDRAEVLHAFQAYYGCGSIRPDRSDKTVKWETPPARGHPRPRDSALHPLPAVVREAAGFRRLRRVVCWMMARGAHRRRDGLSQIVKIAREMNPSGKRRYDAEAVLARLHAG